jgi:squalene-hopene/tetraprenyl-beta-curcumene cyclase
MRTDRQTILTLSITLLAAAAAAAQPAEPPATAPAAPSAETALVKPDLPAVAPIDQAAATQAKDTLARALGYLERNQGEDGSWFPQAGPGVTALVVRGFLADAKYTTESPVVAKALAYILKFVQEDGGIYDKGQQNYTTAICLTALFDADKEKYAKEIRAAQRFLKQMQWDRGEGIEDSDVRFGGAGYGGQHNRPDLSNTSFMLEALHETGIPADDPVFQQALKFISRSQNRAESNDQEWAAVVNDGGFIYTPHLQDEEMSKSGQVVMPDGRRGWRSYGSMTYAGFKSYVYAGLTQGDDRVRGAFDWIRANYDLNNNPNMGKQGLYYYYFVFAKGLRAFGVEKVTDLRGVEHDWRADLIEKLAGLQAEDGSWVNDADRWMEGDPALVTAYCVLALQQTLK